MAGLKLVEELVALAPGRYDIAVIGAEPRPAYNRVLLSSLLAGEIGADDIELRPRDWYAEHGIALLTGQPCDRARHRRARTSCCATARPRLRPLRARDRLRAASACRCPAAILPASSRSATLEDVADVAARGQRGTPVVVIGGGLLGIEAAHGLALRGCR